MFSSNQKKRAVLARKIKLRVAFCYLCVMLCVMLLASNGTAQPNEAKPQGVPRAECFPFERLTVDERAKAEALLLKALDSEALYTIVGNIKPMSSGFGFIKFPIKQIDLEQLAERRRILATWRCGETLDADVQMFARTFNGERSFDSIVLNLPLVRRMVKEKQTFFRRWGITPNTTPSTIVMTIETDETSARNIGYGYLFGYPDYAVNFFGEAMDAEERTGVFVTRDFISIPTVEGERRFVWAVPKNYVEADVDRAYRERAAHVLLTYKERRERFIGKGKAGAVALLRDWFCDARGFCSPEDARLLPSVTSRNLNP